MKIEQFRSIVEHEGITVYVRELKSEGTQRYAVEILIRTNCGEVQLDMESSERNLIKFFEHDIVDCYSEGRQTIEWIKNHADVAKAALNAKMATRKFKKALEKLKEAETETQES